MPKVFHDNDEGFLGWRNANPTGFVVSCAIEPRTAYVILHQTKCEVLSGDPPRGEHWTSPAEKGLRGVGDRVGGMVEERGGGLSAALRVVPLAVAGSEVERRPRFLRPQVRLGPQAEAWSASHLVPGWVSTSR